MIVGFDPGKSGGFATITDGGILMAKQRMPVIRRGKRDLVDTRQLDALMKAQAAAEPIRAIVIELVHARPGQGVSSMFNFGRHVGSIEGMALAYGRPIEWVTPARWKKYWGLSKDKRASLEQARLTFGDDKTWDILANDGIAEAALMAEFYRRHII